jgi:hypothetical protein
MEIMGTAAATIVLDAINAGLEKKAGPNHSPQDRSRTDRARVDPQRKVGTLSLRWPQIFLTAQQV